MEKVELLAPAGSLKKLEYALAYGADAVYAGLKDYSLRSAGLTLDEIEKAVNYTRKKGKKIYAALNIFASNADIDGLKQTVDSLNTIKPDALIIADPGLLSLIVESSDIPVHVSTQANVTNYKSVDFWKKSGAKRVTLARELSLEEITEINSKTDVETEIFIHGAMCFSYSGRCYLSRYLEGRDANKGDCAQPCRWGYEESQKSKIIIERNQINNTKNKNSNHTRENRFIIQEDERGDYILSSKDLCLIEHIPDLVKTGIKSFKIEGRMKSAHYVSSVTKVYRQAIDLFYSKPEDFKIKEEWLAELKKVSHRPYSTGFLFCEGEQVKGHDSYTKTAEFVGEVTGRQNGGTVISVKNRLANGEQLDVLTPQGDNFNWKIEEMVDKRTGLPLEVAHANYAVLVKEELQKYSLLRRSNAKQPNT